MRSAFQPGWGRTLLVGSVLTLLPFPGWPMLCGWCARCFERGVHGREGLAPFDDAVGLTVDGLAPLATLLLFAVLPAVGIIALAANLPPWLIATPQALVVAMLVSTAWAVGYVLLLKLLPGALILVTVRRSLFAALDVRSQWRLVQGALGEFVLAVTFYVLSQGVAQFGLLLGGVGLLPALVWNHGVTAWVLGRVWAHHPLREALGATRSSR